MKYLQVIESAYRGSIEEQDDTIVWLTLAMKGAGADLDVLLRGNAVNYVHTGQDASGLKFGEWQQTQPPRIHEEVQKLIGKGAKVFAVSEDLRKRGLSGGLLPNIEAVSERELVGLYEQYDRVSYW
ncbi:MAG TPA: DsrE family protein [Gammaproteobacteria bacterium]